MSPSSTEDAVAPPACATRDARARARFDEGASFSSPVHVVEARAPE
jgi:hypothetical protein